MPSKQIEMNDLKQFSESKIMKQLNKTETQSNERKIVPLPQSADSIQINQPNNQMNQFEFIQIQPILPNNLTKRTQQNLENQINPNIKRNEIQFPVQTDLFSESTSISLSSSNSSDSSFSSNSETNETNSNLKELQMTKIIKMKELKQIEEWTNLHYQQIIFDSKKDHWNLKQSIFNSQIIGKKQLLFLIENDENEIFGYYLHNKIIEKYSEKILVDKNSFHFTLHSKQIKSPIKFEIIDNTLAGYQLYEQRNNYLIELGDIIIMKEELKKKSFATHSIKIFNYHGLSNGLFGKKKSIDGCLYFTPKRIVILQFN